MNSTNLYNIPKETIKVKQHLTIEAETSPFNYKHVMLSQMLFPEKTNSLASKVGIGSLHLQM